MGDEGISDKNQSPLEKPTSAKSKRPNDKNPILRNIELVPQQNSQHTYDELTKGHDTNIISDKYLELNLFSDTINEIPEVKLPDLNVIQIEELEEDKMEIQDL